MVYGDNALETLIIYGGGMIILYSILKSWGIITVKTKQDFPTLANWKPLTDHELNQMRVDNVNPLEIYSDDGFEVRTGRWRNKEFGFVG